MSPRPASVAGGQCRGSRSGGAPTPNIRSAPTSVTPINAASRRPNTFMARPSVSTRPPSRRFCNVRRGCPGDRRVGPHDEHGDAEVGEDLHLGAQLDHDVEHDRGSDRPSTGSRPPQSDRDEQLGEDDRLRRDACGTNGRAGCRRRTPAGLELRTIASWAVTRPQVTVPPNQSGSSSLLTPDAPYTVAHSNRSSHSGQRRRLRGEGPSRSRRLASDRPTSALPARLIDRIEEDREQVRTVVVDVGGRLEQVVADDARREHGGDACRPTDRHGDGGDDARPKKDGEPGRAQLGRPGRVRLVEVVVVGVPSAGIDGERTEVHDRDGADEHTNQCERPHTDGLGERLVSSAEQFPNAAHGTSRRVLRRMVVSAGRPLRDDVTVASR